MPIKILIIEDETRMSQLLKLYLEKESFEIDIDNNGEVGLNHALVDHYDLVIINVLLPLKDGFTVLEEYRRTKTTPVLMISALCGDNVEKRSLEMGANEYMLMPFSPSKVVSKIKQLLIDAQSLSTEEFEEPFHHSIVDLNGFGGADHSIASSTFG